MVQTSIENKVCRACGAEARTNALFCYKCGGSLAAKDDDAATKTDVRAENNASVADGELIQPSIVPFSENDGESGTEIKVVKVKKQIVAEEVSAPETVLVNQVAVAPEVEKKSSIHEEAKLKSAASLRRKSKTLQPKIVEEVWQEHQNAPNIWFISAAIFLTVLTIGFLFLAIYLK